MLGTSADFVAAAPEDAASLSALLAPLESFRAGFKQAVTDAQEEVLENSVGTVLLARGNRFSWHILEPYEQQLISDGSQIWQYDADLEQVVIREVSKDQQASPTLILSGDVEQLAERYDVALLESSETATRYRLTPVNEHDLFASLELSFNEGTPVQLILGDSFGQRTVIDFVETEINPAIEVETFSFSPPEGAAVISDY